MNNHPEGLSDGQIEWLRSLPSDFSFGVDAVTPFVEPWRSRLIEQGFVTCRPYTKGGYQWKRRWAARALIDLLDRKERERAERGLTIPAELVKEILDYHGPCDHIDHHGYCQSHGLQPVEECFVGQLRRLADVPGEGE